MTETVHPLLVRLVERSGATWVAAAEVAAFESAPDAGVLFLAGDPRRFPEALDLAVVLPELRGALSRAPRSGPQPGPSFLDSAPTPAEPAVPRGDLSSPAKPDLLRSELRIGVVVRADEDEVARRYGVQRWPSLVFVRDGGYLGTLSGMKDWAVLVAEAQALLAAPPARRPGVGIPIVPAEPGPTCG